MREQTVEPVFGIIKSVLGFRQFSLHGLRKVTVEWNLVCLAWIADHATRIMPFGAQRRGRRFRFVAPDVRNDHPCALFGEPPRSGRA